MRLGGLLTRTLAVLAMLGAALGAAEAISRLAFRDYSDEAIYSQMVLNRLMNSAIVSKDESGSSARSYGYTPNTEKTFEGAEYRYTMRTNSLGFRSRELVPHRSGEYRVLLLGDSMFVGIGAQEGERIDARLEELARRKAAPGIPALSVFNFAVGGFNTAQELVVLRRFIRDVQPDHVVLGFFVANDLLPNAFSRINEAGECEMVEEKVKAMTEKVRRDQSFLFLPSVVLRILVLNLYVPRLRYAIASSPEVLDHSFDLLRQVQGDCRKSGVPLSVVVIYPRDGVRGGWAEAWSHSRGVGRKIVRFCRSQGMEVLDLLSIMNGSEAAGKYFFRKDGHLNPEGNRVVAEALYGKILVRRLHAEAPGGSP